ncbi:MAG: NAD(P)-dependent oxidoreductase [Candidatus Daviesbacteria bacterium]|nr:NAD(P)-dependent oxidoreductase [Candidatus Daviesbacteria bacterium]
MNMKKACIFGGEGFVGKNLVEELNREGWEYDVVDKRHPVEPLDITNNDHQLEIERRVKECDVLFNLAAIPAHRLSISDPYNIIYNNYVVTLRAAELCRKYNKKLVHASSFSVYGNQGIPWREDSPMQGTTPYSHSKIIGEELLEMYSKIYGTDIIVARLSNVFGSSEYLHLPKQVVPTWLDLVKEQKQITVYGETTTRDFTYSWDVARALIILSNQKGYDRFNVCSGEETKLIDVAGWMTNDVKVEELPSHEATRWVGDNSKMMSLGWAPTKTIYSWIKEEMLRRGMIDLEKWGE